MDRAADFQTDPLVNKIISRPLARCQQINLQTVNNMCISG